MNEFHLLRPWWLLALLPLFFAVIRLYKHQKSNQTWRGIVDEALAPYVLVGEVGKNRLWPSAILAISGMLAIIALTGPVWQKQPMPVFRADHKLVIVLDLSHSMDASDVKPSRLTRAKHKIGDIISGFQDMQTGLVVFSEVPYIVSPVTDDVDTISAFLPALSTAIMPVQGGRISLALDKAGELLSSANSRRGQVLLISDSAVDANALSSAKKLMNGGYTLSVLAVGTENGGPVRLPDGSLLKDMQNNIVVPGVNITGLRDLAQTGGGAFSVLSTDSSDIQSLIDSSPDLDTAVDTDSSEKFSDLWIEHGIWLVFPVLLLVAGLFRRGVLS